jgi:hypothetical protein
MKSLIAVVVVIVPAILAAASAPARANVALVDNNKTVDIDCAKDPEVSVLGNNLIVSLTGVCTKLIVAGNNAKVTGSATLVLVPGNNNTVTIDAADNVSVPGNDNTVTVKKAIKLKAPKVSNPGNHNKVN